MEVILLILALVLVIGGIIFSVLPPFPGPVLSFLAMLVTHFASSDRPFSIPWLFFFGLLTAAVTVLDLLMPAIATKKFGGTRAGIYGGLIGTVFGIFMPIPFGIIWGPLLGAIVGDLIGGNQIRAALKSGIASFVGFMVATFLKVFVSILFGILIVIRIGSVIVDGIMEWL